MPTKTLRPTKAQSNAAQQLRVQQLLIPEIEKLQQQEIQAQQPLSINKSHNRRAKPTPKPKAKSNRLEAPYKKATVKPTVKPESRTVTFGDTTLVLPRDQQKLEALKQEAVEYWRNLPEIT